MKKIFILMVLFLFPIISMGEEVNNLKIDKVFVEKANVIVNVASKSLYVQKIFYTGIEYGDKADTYYLDFYLPNKNIVYNAKENKFDERNVNISKIYIESKTAYEIFSEEKGKYFRFGEDPLIFPEKDTLSVSYDVEYGMDLVNNSFPIYLADYQTNEIDFSLFINKMYSGKKIFYSLNNKNFFEKIDGLNITISDEGIIYGKYNKKIEKGKGIYLLITDVDIQTEIVSNNNLVIIIGSIIIISLILTIYIIKKKKA